jgi:hypothetical protein
MMVPAHLFGLEMIDLILRNDGRFYPFAARRYHVLRQGRRQRRGIRGRSKRGAAGDCAKRK